LHGRIAATLESGFIAIVESQPQLMAQHCAEAGMSEKAISYWLKAGQRSMARSAMTEAEAQLQKGLALLLTLPESGERNKRELDLQMALAIAVMATQGLTAPAVGEVLLRAHQLCTEVGRADQLVAILAHQCQSKLLRGELELAGEESKKLLELGEARSDPAILVTSHLLSTNGSFHLGHFDEAHAYAEQALALYNPMYPPVSAVDPQILALTFSFRSLVYLGRFEQARRGREQTLALARQRRDFHTLAMVIALAIMCDGSMQSDASIMEPLGEELAAMCSEHKLPYWNGVAEWCRGACLSAKGRTEDALLCYQGVNRNLTKAVTGRTHYFNWIAEDLGKAGRPAEGLKQLEESERQIEISQERWMESDMHRVRGQLLIALGDVDAAEASFRQAVTVARRQNAKLWEIRAATSHARLWRDQGNRGEAHDLVASIYGWFTEGFDTPVLQDAKNLLDQLRQ
jgi:tetratricopeptide (TPR) repeat protein